MNRNLETITYLVLWSGIFTLSFFIIKETNIYKTALKTIESVTKKTYAVVYKRDFEGYFEKAHPVHTVSPRVNVTTIRTVTDKFNFIIKNESTLNFNLEESYG